jgi:Zn-dependent protease
MPFRVEIVGAQLNASLAFFNLIPFPPLDGSHILAAFLPTSALDKYERFSRYGLLFLLFLLFLAERFTIWLAIQCMLCFICFGETS